MNTSIEATKAMIRAQLGLDIRQAVKGLQEESGSSYEAAWEEARIRHPDLFRSAERIEADRWEAPKVPIYRYVDAGTGPKSFRSSWALGASKAKEDDRELMLVMAADGTVTDLQLVAADHSEKIARETQKLIDRTDGPLHRKIAEHLVRDANPSLDERAQQDEDLENAQMEIKRRIKELRDRNPKLSFRDAWEQLQRTDPQLFEELPELN